MISNQYRISAGIAVAITLSVTASLLSSGCASVTQVDLQLSPASSADSLDATTPESSEDAAAAAAKPASGDILMIGGAGSAKSTIASAEFFSAATGKFKATGAMKKARAVAGGAALPAQGHEVAIFGGMKGRATSSIELLVIHSKVLNSAETYDGTTGKFTTVANPMDDGRTGFTTTVFPSGPLAGKVLLAGGDDGNGPVDTAEIFDPTNNTFTAAGNTMTDPRELHTATLLNDGKVLLAGGLKDKTGDISVTADIFDPSTQMFTRTTGDMTIGGRAAHTASLLGNGKVLLIGGSSSMVVPPNTQVNTRSDAEVYDPSGGTFTTDSFMIEGRSLHAAVTLGDGRILVTGGMSGSITINGGKLRGGGITSNSGEIYDPNAHNFTCVNGGSGPCNKSMLSTRAGHIAMLIASGPNAGKVLLAGGVGAKSRFSFNDLPLKTAEIVTVTGTTATSVKATMTAARVGFTAVTVP